MKRDPALPSRILAVGWLAGLLALLTACGSTQESPLPGAVYAKKVPVYRGAKYVGSVGGESTARIGARASVESRSWFLTTGEPAEKLVAFYKRKLPDAKLAVNDAGESTFTLIPPGAEKGEVVQVIVRKGGDLQIKETVKPGKKQG